MNSDEWFHDEAGRLLPSVLAQAQRLPPATRKRLVSDLARYDPPGAWKDDEVFYGWLREHYVSHGSGHVDASLRRQGGNDARRTLRTSLLVMVRQAIEDDDADEDVAFELAASAEDPKIVAIVQWYNQIIGIGVPSSASEEMCDGDRQTGTDTTIATARSVLDRLAAEPDEALLVLLDGVIRQIGDGLDRNMVARVEEGRAAVAYERERAIDDLIEAVGDVSPDRRGLLAAIEIEVDSLVEVEAIAQATSAVRALVAAEDALTHAQKAVDAIAGRGPERTAAIAERRTAVFEAETAAQRAAEQIELILPSETSAAPAEIGGEIDCTEESRFDEAPSEMPAPDLAAPDEDGPSLIEEPNAATVAIALSINDGLTSDDNVGLADEPDHDDAAPINNWDEWVALALDAGHVGLATHIARAQSLAGASNALHSTSAAVLEAVLVGRSVEGSADRASGRYATLAPSLIDVGRTIRLGNDSGYGTALAILAGGLRASLVAPYAGAHVLEALPAGGPLTPFRDLLEFAMGGPQLSLTAIRDLAPAEERQVRDRQLRDAISELESWHEAARNRKLPYQLASVMWRDLIAPHGDIGSVIVEILGAKPDAAMRARALIEALRSDPDDYLTRAFDSHLSRTKAVRLDGIARDRCLSLFEEARDRIEAWLRVSGTNRLSADRFEKPRVALTAALKSAAAALVELRGARGATARGAVLLSRTVDDLVALLDGREAPPVLFEKIMDSEIALLLGFPVNGRVDLTIGVDDVEPLRRAALTLADGIPGWRQAFEHALESGAVGVARRIRSLLADDAGEDEHRIDAARLKQVAALEAKRSTLREKLDDLQTASTGSSQADSLITELEASLVSLSEVDLAELPIDGLDGASAIGDFPAMHARLNAFERDLDIQRQIVSAELERRIEHAEAGTLHLSECRALLHAGDLGTLAEDLAQIERHGPDAGGAVNARDLLAPLQQYTGTVLKANVAPLAVRMLIEPARTGCAIGPFRFDLLPAAERADAAALIDIWVGLKRAAQSMSDGVERTLVAMLGAIGFGGVKVLSHKPWRNVRRFEVKTDPIRSASDCIIPAFGSQANGRYTILVAPQGTLEKCLIGFDELPDQVLAFATEWLIPKVRDQFLRRARQRPAASFALLDEAGIGALAAMPGRGLRHFFDLTVPFGAARPYADTGAATSLEMFFGRQSEYAQLEDPQGSCLVYGGRQLGKTALLKQIQLRNTTNPDIAVIYCDIKRVGASEQSVAVWDHIATELKARLNGTEIKSGEQVIDTIQSWLRGAPTRRVLMLLDEADAFLEREMAEDFAIIMKMKGLMEGTGRRAKFVFAGLHNVQRFVRTPNSPMLHLGRPVNIGPLLGHDRDAARRMVFEPMAAAGIGFKRPTDAHHMLSLVGYYPSLLQTFGKTILARIDRELARGEAAALPWLIERQALTDSFNATEFRSELVEKFRATLQLDLRYELVTYAVCYRVDEDRQRGNVGSGGYTAPQIRELALEYWPQGFATTRSTEMFEALLDEMVGLGVLNRDGERYTLRSARIAAMLGGGDEIQTKLLEFGDLELPHKSDPMANHRLLQNGGYAPLPLRQEKALIDQFLSSGNASPIVLIAHSRAAASTDDLLSSLDSLALTQAWPEPRRLDFRRTDDLRKVIGDVRRDSRPGRPKLIVCTGRCPDAAELVEISRFRELRDQSYPVRVIVLAGPEDVIAAEISGDFGAIRAAGVTAIDVQPWDREAIHHWLNRHADAAGDDIGFASAVVETCGGFAGILDEAVLPSGTGRDDVVRRIEAAARRVVTPEFLGLTDPRLRAFIARVADYGAVEIYGDQDIATIASEVEPAHAAQLVRTAKRLGLLREVQKSGSPQVSLNPVVVLAVAPSSPAA